MRILCFFNCIWLLGLSACQLDGEARDPAAPPAPAGLAVADASLVPETPGHLSPPEAGAASGAGLPCAVSQLLRNHCGKCHGQVPEPGVPISLVSYADLTARTEAGVRIFERVKLRVRETQRPMPPVREQDPLGANDLKTLDDWIAGGALPNTEACALDALPVLDAGADNDPACEYLPVLTAHNGQEVDDTDGFEVPLADTTYECFNFAIPWGEPVQALEFVPVIGDGRVVHHIGLYSLKSPLPPGTHARCEGGPDRTMVSGWSPGQGKLSWPPGYGALMPHDKSGGFQLEIHYDNVARHRTRDRSGLKVCATTQFRPNTLAMHVLSSDESFQIPPGRQQVVNSCAVWSDKGPATVLAASPHMHRLGVHLSTVVTHTDGSRETITDQPFAFDDQAIQFLKKPVMVRKGDVLTTTCSYLNTTGAIIRYSKGSDGEMCGNALIASPPGSLTGGLAGAIIDLLGVPNLCIGIGAEPLFGL